jgi:hypothetical protein
MKIKTVLLLLYLVAGHGTAFAETAVPMPQGKVSFSLFVPRESVDEIKPGQRVTVEASKGRKGKNDPAPVIQGAVVLDGLILDVGKKVMRDGTVTLVIAVTPSEAQNLENAQAQKAVFTIDVMPSSK